MSRYITMLERFNTDNYPNYKAMYWGEPETIDNDTMINLYTQPHYFGHQGIGDNVEQAKEQAARSMLQVWKEFDKMASEEEISPILAEVSDDE